MSKIQICSGDKLTYFAHTYEKQMLGSISNFDLDLSDQWIKFKRVALEKMMTLHFSIPFYVIFHDQNPLICQSIFAYEKTSQIRNYHKCESHIKATSLTPTSELANTIIKHLPH